MKRVPRALRCGLVSIISVCGVGPAWGAWPLDPAAPLVAGNIQGLGAIHHAAARTLDGATWIAWVDMQCFGSLRLQRIDSLGSILEVGGLALDDPGGCLLQQVHLEACEDGSVVVSRPEAPVRRIAPDGASMWGPGISLSGEDSIVGGFLSLPGGDVLVVWNDWSTIFVNRYTAAGTATWPRPAAIPNMTGPNMRIFKVVADGHDGAFIFWDSPTTYTRSIWTARVTGEGAPAWASPLHITPFPGSSRHTNPVAIADGTGGAVVVWTVGAESWETIVPLLMQRISAGGSMVYESEGRRVSLPFTRQFDPAISRDEAGGDVFIAWRDGMLSQLRAQRMTLSGDRAWGDSGVSVTTLAGAVMNYFEAIWQSGQLRLIVAGESSSPGAARVKVHRLDATGSAIGIPWIVSGTQPTGAVHSVLHGDALAIAWLQDQPTFDDLIVAQRVNADGTIGLPALQGDLNGDGAVNGLDLAHLLSAWSIPPGSPGCGGAKSCPADLNSDGLVNGLDLASLLASWAP